MKASQINNIITILNRLSTVQLPMKKAYQIYLLAKEINEHREFFINKEKELVDKYQAKIDIASGLISFVNNDDRDKFQAEYLELMNVDVELAAAPIIISESDANDFKISPAEIASLEGLIDFE